MPQRLHITPCTTADQPGWLDLRHALWPDASRDEHRADLVAYVDEPDRYGQWVAYDADGTPVGLAEAAVRHDYVNGTDTSPVVFLEGLYVVPAARRRGIAAALVEEVKAWARHRGCSELASDALLENGRSHAMHRALGFEETERVVYYRLSL